MRTEVKSRKVSGKTVYSKYLYIKIADIISMASGIVGLSASLATVIKSLKNINTDLTTNKPTYDTESIKTLGQYGLRYGVAMCKPILSPIYALIKADEILRTVLTVYLTTKPIIETAALVSGVVFSPGNVGEIAMIGLGVAQKVLVSLALKLFEYVKNLILNIEFPILIGTKEIYDVIAKTELDELKYNSSKNLPQEADRDEQLGESANLPTTDFAFIKELCINGIYYYIAGSSKDKGLFYLPPQTEQISKDDLLAANWYQSWLGEEGGIAFDNGNFYNDDSIDTCYYVENNITKYVAFVGTYSSSKNNGMYYSIDNGMSWNSISNIQNTLKITNVKANDNLIVDFYTEEKANNEDASIYYSEFTNKETISDVVKCEITEE